MFKLSGNIDNMTMVKIVDRESGLVWKPIRLRDLLTNECWDDMWSETDEEGDVYSLPIKDWRQDCEFDNCDITIYNEGDIAKVRHKKTGDIYDVEKLSVINCTNANDGQLMVLYHKDGLHFVREQTEFFEKFEEIKNDK